MGWVLIFDVIVLPLCVLLFLGYHAFLCYSYRNKPHLTTIGLSAVRRAWPSSIIEDESKSMLVAQSLRNTIMGSVLSAVVATALISSLAAFTNNSYNARNFLMSSPIFGSQAIGLRDLKYSAATVSLIASFLFSSIAVGCFVEAQFLPIFPKLQEGYIEKMLERGFLLAFLGNRALQFSFPLLLWMLGSVPFALSTLTLI